MKTIFITGATSGIGLVTAITLASRGNKILATARSMEKGQELLTQYKTQFPAGKGTIEIIICDLASFESIVAACHLVKQNHTNIDVLINNAGVWNFGYRKTINNIEETLQVNVLAPLLINYLLLDLLTHSKNAKSIFAASALHQGHVDLKNLEFKHNFSGFKAYRQSKLAVILLCRLLAQKLMPANIGVYCEHPGLVSTKLGRDAGWFSNLFFTVMGLPAEKGARTLIYLAEEDKNHLISGEYYARKQVKKITPQSYDLVMAEKLLYQLKVYLAPYISTPSLVFQAKP